MNIPNAKEQTIPEAGNALKALLFILVLTIGFVGMTFISGGLSSDNVLTRTLSAAGVMLVATINAMLILGMAVLAHEAVHNVLFRSKFANDLGGGLLSAVSLIPFFANRQFHLSHHSYAHQEQLDPECTMHSRGFLFAFFIGPHVGIFVQHRKFLMNLVRGFKQPKYLRRFVFDALFLHAAIGYYVLLIAVFDVSALFAYLPTALMFTIVFSFRAMSDHYGLPRVKRKSEKRKEIGTQAELEKEGFQIEQPSGWVVLTHPFLDWLWSHVNYHEVHHKYPYLSHAHLPGVFEATKHEQSYAVVKGFFRNLKQLWGRDYFHDSANNR